MTSDAPVRDCWSCPTHRAARRFSATAHARLARKVVFRLQRLAASGVFGDDLRAKSVWDEYCYEAQHGPTDALTSAWDQVLTPTIASVVARLPREEAVLLSIGAAWDLEEFELDLGDGVVAPELIRSNVLRYIDQIAMDRRIERLSGLGFG
ncbi:hypothetical protein [Thalassobaculum sp.]|uniref:hypothetical protein n=1 Tax=Thalassobaculum sp. TaxID=2022740 RepID=UPI0032EA99E2